MSPFQPDFGRSPGRGGKVREKVIRVLKIAWLLQRGDQTVDQLASRFGVSRRTIYRDLKLIDEADLPLVSQQGDRGYRVVPPVRQALGLSAVGAWR